MSFLQPPRRLKQTALGRALRAENACAVESRKEKPGAGRREKGHEKAWRRPTFPRGRPRSIIGAGGLNFRVRNGNGCGPSAIATRQKKRSNLSKVQGAGNQPGPTPGKCIVCFMKRNGLKREREMNTKWSSSRPISTGQLNVSPRLHLRPINLVVFQGPLVPRRYMETSS